MTNEKKLNKLSYFLVNKTVQNSLYFNEYSIYKVKPFVVSGVAKKQRKKGNFI